METQYSIPPSLHSQSSRTSRATSNASISSVCSFSSFSSIDSTNSISMFQSTKPLRRSLTSTSNIKKSNHSTLFDLNDENPLDKLCVPSPISEKVMINEDELNKREIGSPIQKRPIRSKVRRIHSMFYSKKEITDTTNMFDNLMNSSSNLDKILDEDNNLSNSILIQSKIETFKVKNDSIPRINVQTLCKILDGNYNEFFNEITIVDCRFEYEYKGGHINGAVNVSSQKELEVKFLENNDGLKSFQSNKKRLIIFHCEFSSYRGPLMASHLRTCDRNINQDNYPHLDYPDILILEGGYKTFFDSQSQRCFPQKYVEMNDDNHKSTCEKELTRFKRDLKKASSFNNLSFAASINNNTINTTNNNNKHKNKLHRSSTSGMINFSKPSLKSQFLDFTKDNIYDENKPPESLNFAFKFPKPIEKNNNNEMKPPPLPKIAFSQRPHNDTPIIRKKLSRSLTYNM